MLCTFRSNAGRVQLVALECHVVIDIQGCHRGVEGIERYDHGFIALRHAKARELRDVLSRLLALCLNQEAGEANGRKGTTAPISRDAA
jgi:hypothetical protein